MSAPAQGQLGAFLPFRARGSSDTDGIVDILAPLVVGAVVHVDHPRFAPATITTSGGSPASEIRLDAGQQWSGRVEPTPEGRTVHGGRACIQGTLAGARQGRELRWERCTLVKEDGHFTVSGLGPPPWKLTVSAPGHLSESLAVAAGESRPVRLRPGVTLRGTVADEQGEPIEGVTLRSVLSSAASAAGGAFELVVPSLPAKVTVAKSGFVAQTIDVERSEQHLDVRLVATPALAATLLTPTGPYSGKTGVWCSRERQNAGRSSVSSYDVTVSQGTLLAPLPSPGSYAVVVRPEGFQEIRVGSVVVGEGQRAHLGTLMLSRGCGVVGEVADGTTGEPVAHALVEALPVGSTVFSLALARTSPSAVSDRKGRFELGGLRPGRYLVRIQHARYAPAYRVVSITSMLDLGRLSLGPGVVLSGRIQAVGGAAQAGVEVRLLDPARETMEPFASAVTDVQGHYVLPALGPGRYRMELWRGRLMHAEEVAFSQNLPEANLDVEAGGVVLHGLLMAGGVAATGGEVHLMSALDRGRSQPTLAVNFAGQRVSVGIPTTQVSAVVGADGGFTLNDAPTGRVWLGYATRSGTTYVPVEIPSEREVSLPVLLPDTVLRGRVVDESGQGLVATVALVHSELRRETGFTTTEIDGSFAIESILPGVYTVVVSRDRYVPAVLEGVVVPRQEPLPPLVLSPGEGGRIRVTLRRPDHSPVAFTPVSFFGADARFVLGGFTRDEGATDLPPLPAGDYLVAWADPLAGAGSAGDAIRLERGRLVELAPTFAESGCSLALGCPLLQCNREPIEHLSVLNPGGFDLAPLLSGATPELSFGEDGLVSLGRVAPGRFTITLGVGDKRFSKDFVARSDTVFVAF
ncbi:MAG TPA: carboxypeptidase-like regulatory domain-containing protein [Thermoanaerobaculaceae bacterium]|mgnify:CR=1 FL=1|nr:carboxypeptidase-like regulatory domain-containing protein [Thermoanaerobaculaceae bacterium]HRS17370.1 carboxypeptidase-like regulatory domain-containing protein [Thermoanaerobaculaceae bacterium]